MTESEILFENAKHLGVNIIKLYDEFGFEVSERLISKFGKNKNYAVILGLSGNAADGMATAFHLTCAGVKSVKVYLIGRQSSIKDVFAKEIFLELNDLIKEHSNLEIKTDAFAENIIQPDVLVEAITGTGLTGAKLTKRFYDVVKRFSHFNSKLVAIDTPTLHYTPDVTYSLMYPKISNAIVVNLELPIQLENFCGPGEKKALWKAKNKTHKLKNGNLLFIDSGGEHNSKVKKIAKEYSVDLSIFNFEPNGNKESSARSLKADELETLIEQTDTILIGNINKNILSFSVINHILKTYKDKKYVLFDSVLDFVDLQKVKDVKEALILLSKNSNKVEIGKLKRLSKEMNLKVALMGATTYLYGNDSEKVLRLPFKDFEDFILEKATLAASYSTKNDMWLSVRASMY